MLDSESYRRTLLLLFVVMPCAVFGIERKVLSANEIQHNNIYSDAENSRMASNKLYVEGDAQKIVENHKASKSDTTQKVNDDYIVQADSAQAEPRRQYAAQDAHQPPKQDAQLTDVDLVEEGVAILGEAEGEPAAEVDGEQVDVLSVEGDAVPTVHKRSLFWSSWKKIVDVFKETIAKSNAENHDPWESWNRKVFVFNDFADRWVLSPVARSYQWITPDPIEQGVGNVFSNLLSVNIVVNDLLQFKLAQAASDTGRLLVNTTIGIGGLFDVASVIGLEKHDEDFGQTFGAWGMFSGPYIVVPLLGSYTLRDGIGAFGDATLDGITWISHVRTRNQAWAVNKIDQRAGLFAAEALITGDRYAFIRDAYLQRRVYLVNDGELEEDTFGDEEFDDLYDDLEE